MSYATSGKLGVNLGATATTADHALGEQVTGDNGSVWVFVQANGAIGQYDYVCIDEDFQAAKGTKALLDAGHTPGFAQVAFADNDYGWVALEARGTLKVNVLASCAADVPLYSSATAGKLDDDSTSQTKLLGTVIVSADGGSGSAIEFISSPMNNG